MLNTKSNTWFQVILDYVYYGNPNVKQSSTVYKKNTVPKNQAAPIEMGISDFFRIPKTFIAFVSLCHKSH